MTFMPSALGDFETDAAQACDQHRLAPQCLRLRSGEIATPAFAGGLAPDRDLQRAREREHQADGVFRHHRTRHRSHVGHRQARPVDALLPETGFDAGGIHGGPAQFLRGGEHALIAHHVVATRDGICILRLGDEFFHVGNHDDFESGGRRLQRVAQALAGATQRGLRDHQQRFGLLPAGEVPQRGRPFGEAELLDQLRCLGIGRDRRILRARGHDEQTCGD
jgi:hypothetical protein